MYICVFIYIDQMDSGGQLDTGGGEAHSYRIKSLYCTMSCSFSGHCSVTCVPQRDLRTKHVFYVIVLLYCGECITPYKRHLVHLNHFHHCYIRSILGLNRS